ncbi:MAG TPA: hypothetical protein VN512_08555 [Clostridia bacterium]|nr:hypothetical protein [Clostridia bacterium]
MAQLNKLKNDNADRKKSYGIKQEKKGWEKEEKKKFCAFFDKHFAHIDRGIGSHACRRSP